jgi:hypothetical protein
MEVDVKHTTHLEYARKTDVMSLHLQLERGTSAVFQSTVCSRQWVKTGTSHQHTTAGIQAIKAVYVSPKAIIDALSSVSMHDKL